MKEKHTSSQSASPDRPIRLWQPRYWFSWGGVFFVSVLCLLPQKICNLLAEKIATIYARKSSKHKKFASRNLQTCFPELTATEQEKLLTDYFVRFFQIIWQSPKLWWWPQKSVHNSIEVVGKDVVDDLIKDGRSVVFLVSHSIALDFGLVGLARHFPLHGIYKPFKDPVLDWVVRRGRNRFGGITIARDKGLRSIIRNQQDGKCLVYLGDEDLGKKGAVFAPFFAGEKSTLTMLPRLVRKQAAVVVPVFAHYEPDAHKFVVTLLPAIENFPADGEGDDKDVTNASVMNKAIQESVDICREQYFWKLKYFKTVDGEGENIYQS